MKKWFNIVAITLTMVLGSHAMAKDATAAKPLHGKVTAVADDGSTITITGHAKKGETATPTTVKIDAKTEITKDGTKVDVKTLVDAYVAVTLNADGSAAATVEVHAPKKKPTTASK